MKKAFKNTTLFTLVFILLFSLCLPSVALAEATQAEDAEIESLEIAPETSAGDGEIEKPIEPSAEEPLEFVDGEENIAAGSETLAEAPQEMIAGDEAISVALGDVAAPMEVSLPTWPATEVHGDYKYSLYQGSIIISGYSGNDAVVNVPGQFNGQPIAIIDGMTFWGKNNITTINIPSGISQIWRGDGFYLPFDLCPNLANINVDAANAAYSSVNGVLFNKDKTELVYYPLGKTATSYSIPATVKKIGVGSFLGNTKLNSVTIPGGVTTISQMAFRECTSITGINIPASVTSIEERAFSVCSKMSKATFEGNAPKMGSTVFGATASDFKIIYKSGKTGWTTPTWNGYPCYPDKVVVKSIKFKTAAHTLSAKDKTIDLNKKITIAPSNATNKGIKWTTSDKKIVAVSSSGIATAKASKGVATITATAKDGSGVKATIKIYVGKKVGKVTLDKTKSTLSKPGKTTTLKATVTAGAAYKKVKWTTSNKSVATVDSKGKVKAVAKGTATITVTTQDGSGKKAACKITVKQPVKKIVLDKTTATIKKGGKVTLKPTVTPSIANNKKVTWKSSNAKIATVSSKGVVKGIKKGTVTITCIAADGSGKKVTCKVTVK